VYRGLIDTLVIDEADSADAGRVAAMGIRPVIAQTIMRDEVARRGLAQAVLSAAGVSR
jgi:hypothetical protein